MNCELSGIGQVKQVHMPVLCKEVVSSLNCKNGGFFVDCTVGGGGHAEAILECNRVNKVIALDKDINAVRYAKTRLSKYLGRLKVVHAGFEKLMEILDKSNVSCVDGVLFDVGISSLQLGGGGRGFSFSSESCLDMRMDQSSGETAADFVNKADEKILYAVIKEYGEERSALRIARAIVNKRRKERIETTGQLVSVIESVKGRKRSRIHPATKTFQALRIHVNNELENLRAGLKQAFSVLRKGGRLAIISFHSLEDKIAKHYFKYLEKDCVCPPGALMCTCRKETMAKIIGKMITPSKHEIERNPRSRSAKLRVIEKLKGERE
ncbi:MAG: 16S rRNA (cytosine(1402)-N(4))-methyltransferase RsmH [Candidatus Auribacterota bacterium]|nr:16S rRNA (cytosine(1402)-N(4))-methyltransferase RsmH [Candidatus Auribacterota bacterium]